MFLAIEKDPPKTEEVTTTTESGTTKESGTTDGTVFVYPLYTFNTLESYFNRKREPVPLSVHSTVDKRVDALMGERYIRGKERWSHSVLSVSSWPSMTPCNEKAKKKFRSKNFFLC